VILSFQIPLGAQDSFRLAARPAANGATQAAENAMRDLVAAGGGALLAFLAMIGLSGPTGTGRTRRSPQRRGVTDGGTWQQSYCDKAWADRVAIGLIASAVRALDHPDDQERYREEWAADSDEIPGKWQRLRWALLLRLCAPMGIQSARQNALSVSPPQQQ
jgi:hypothetical protein